MRFYPFRSQFIENLIHSLVDSFFHPKQEVIFDVHITQVLDKVGFNFHQGTLDIFFALHPFGREILRKFRADSLQIVHHEIRQGFLIAASLAEFRSQVDHFSGLKRVLLKLPDNIIAIYADFLSALVQDTDEAIALKFPAQLLDQIQKIGLGHAFFQQGLFDHREEALQLVGFGDQAA